MALPESAPPFMARALELARGVKGRTSPNPAVGAVLVRGGRIVGEGATEPYGGPHAEPMALAAAGDLARGATLYVTLEPCSHHGRTPPCADALVAAGIAEAHIATLATHPELRRNGIGRRLLARALQQAAQEGLRSAYLEVRAGNQAAQALYRSFGFVEDGRRPGYYKDNGEDAILMSLGLNVGMFERRNV